METSHRVLIPEILAASFASLTKPELYAAALVCVSWSQLALEELWKYLNSILPLLRVLSPMERVNGNWVRYLNR